MSLETLQVNTRLMLIDTTFNLTVTWHDSRVTFFNLKPSSSLNTIPTNGTLWNPDIAFVNTLDHASTKTDEKTDMYVERHLKSVEKDLSIAKEGECVFILFCVMLENCIPGET